MRTAFLFLLPSLGFLSCSSLHYIDIQVLNPAQVKITKKIDTLYIIDNKDLPSVIASHKGACYKGFSNELPELLKESPVFQDIPVVARSYPDMRRIVSAIDEEKQKGYYYVLPSVKVYQDNTEKKYDFETQKEISLLYFRFEVNTIDASNEVCIDSFTKIDTLFWSKNQNTDKYEIPNKILYQIGQISSEAFARHWAPWWEEEERALFYSINGNMMKAYEYFTSNDLQSAINTWEHVYNVGAKYLASMAAYNIALVYEIQDDLDQSEYWLNQSLKAKQRPEASVYLETIKKRKAQKEKLDSQLNN
jgi:hypothetical protein